MKMIWLGSVLAAFGLAMSAHAAEPVCVDRIFSCPVKDAKGRPVFLQVHTTHDTYAEVVMTTANNEEPSEPKPGSCRLEGDTISVNVKVEVTQQGESRRALPTKRERDLTLRLRWIPGKNSKDWELITGNGRPSRQKPSTVCTEAM